MAPSSSSSTQTNYFGYGSNLWREQMTLRCPKSTFLGIGRLTGYRWLINERGYANVAELESHSGKITVNATSPYEKEVYGLVYSLRSSDEAALDRNEGVPFAYTKELMSIDFWPASSPDSHQKIDVTGKSEQRQMLVYIDRRRIKDSTPKQEYIYRMNHGINDALAAGVPVAYVDEVMRKAIPPLDESGVDGSLKMKAKRQAVDFKDE